MNDMQEQRHNMRLMRLIINPANWFWRYDSQGEHLVTLFT
jgi:hypothetical protein